MGVDLFAGISVSDLDRAVGWYGQLLGAEPAFFPNDVEAVWEVDEHRYLYVRLRPEHAGHALTTLVLDGSDGSDGSNDLDDRVRAIAGRGLEPVEDETYANGVRKVTYRDPDGNELGFGGVPGEA